LRILIVNNGVAFISDVQNPSSPRHRKKPSNKGTTADFRTRCGPGEDKTAGNSSRPNLSDETKTSPSATFKLSLPNLLPIPFIISLPNLSDVKILMPSVQENNSLPNFININILKTKLIITVYYK
jgi:hypothetical protein